MPLSHWSIPGSRRLILLSSVLLFLACANCQSSTTTPRPIDTTTPRPIETKTQQPLVTKLQDVDCRLVTGADYRQELSKYLDRGAKLVKVQIVHIEGYPVDSLTEELVHIYAPYHWVRSTSRQGRSLLMLDDNYDYMSMNTLNIGVERVKVSLNQTPVDCLWGKSEEVLVQVLRHSFLNDFKVPVKGERASLSEDEHICNMQIIDDDGTARFIYRCCSDDARGNLVCEDMVKDIWLKILIFMVITIKLWVVLFSPMFLPESLYRLKYVAAEYIHHLPKPLKLKVVVTQNPRQFGPESKHKRIRLNRLKQMEHFKVMVTSGKWEQDKIYEVAVQDVRVSVKLRRLMDQNANPVTMLKLIHTNFLRCRIRKWETFVPCCNTSVLGKFKPDLDFTWKKCVRMFAGLVTLLLIATPWFFRCYIYNTHEAGWTEMEKQAANRAGLDMPIKAGSIVMYLSPVHGLFIFIYLIFIIDSVVYNVISSAMKEKFKTVMRQCLRDMRERSKLEVLAWFTKLELRPFEEFGLLGFVIFPFYIVILLVVATPIVCFYIFPFINLSVRLIIHIFIFVLPRRITERITQFCNKLSGVSKELDTERCTRGENFINKSQFTTKGVILQIVVVTMCLISFWSLTLLMVEIVSFFVQIFVYTFMGLIINAAVTMQFVTVIFLLLIYSNTVFSRVSITYQAYHRVIQKQLLAMKREEIDEVAKHAEFEQDNAAFTVAGDLADPTPPEEATPRLVVRDPEQDLEKHEVGWATASMLVFLDRTDNPYTPETFFFNSIDLNYFGCPGPIYRLVSAACLEFARIVVFLLFVFIVVMAFGDAYQVSTTNQLLATVVGGFVPLMFRFIFQANNGVSDIDTNSVQFKTEFHHVINEYRQTWPVYDIIPVENGIKEWAEEPEVDETILSSIDETKDEIIMDSSITPLLENSTVSDGSADLVRRKRPVSYISVAEKIDQVDLIVDISTPKTRSMSTYLTKGFDKGSHTMLDKGFQGSTNDSVYKPTTHTSTPNNNIV